MLNVASSAGIEIIDAHDFVAALKQPSAQVRAYETGAAGDQNTTFSNMGVPSGQGHSRQLVLRSFR